MEPNLTKAHRRHCAKLAEERPGDVQASASCPWPATKPPPVLSTTCRWSWSRLRAAVGEGLAGSPRSHARQPGPSPCIDPWQAAPALSSITQGRWSLTPEDSEKTCFVLKKGAGVREPGPPLPPACLAWAELLVVFLELSTYLCPQLREGLGGGSPAVALEA